MEELVYRIAIKQELIVNGTSENAGNKRTCEQFINKVNKLFAVI
jgi:hypothetical protein